jgi:hypothetical protein
LPALEKIADPDIRIARLREAARLATQHLINWQQLFEHGIEILAAHADDPLAAPEGVQPVFAEANVAHKQAAGPSSLLAELALENVEIGRWCRLGLPFCFKQIGVAGEIEAAVDLLSTQAKTVPGLEAEEPERIAQETFKGKAALLGRKIPNREKSFTGFGDLWSFESGCRGGLGCRWLAVGESTMVRKVRRRFAFEVPLRA